MSRNRAGATRRVLVAATALALTAVTAACTPGLGPGAAGAFLPPRTSSPTPAATPAATPASKPSVPSTPDPTVAPEPTPVPEPTATPVPPPTPSPTPGPGPEPTPDATPGPTPVVIPTPSPAPSATPGAAAQITVAGNRILRGGEPWWFLGYSSFVWSGDCGYDDETMTAADVDAWFASMRHDGHGAARLFFYDGWDLARLDAAIASARRHDVYLILTLDDAIGGCGESDKTAEWFADPGERAVYEAHMRMLLERYRGEHAIAWFEFFNEPDDEARALRAFYDEMGAVADTVDPQRLFSSGTVAPYWVDGAENFLDIHLSPGVDIASLHEYDEDEIESNHGPRVRAAAAGKPVIVGEFGIEAGPDCDVDFAERAERFADKAAAYTAEGYVGALAWAWQPGRDDGGCDLGNLDVDPATQGVLRTAGG